MGESLQSLILAGLGLAVIYVAVWRPWRRAGGGGAGDPASSAAFRAGAEAETERALDQVLLSLQELSRETLAKLDTKIRLLNRYVMDADERIRRLEELTAKAGGERPGAAAGVAPAAAGTPAAGGAPMVASVPAVAPAAVVAAAIPAAPAPVVGTSPVSSAGMPAPGEPASPERGGVPVQELQRRVYELAERGLSNVEIAREMDRPRGEIELLMHLRPAPPAAAATASGGGVAERGRRARAPGPVGWTDEST
ncbi:MAG: hypothetical protein HZA54_20465 [Planctomycetes bacterium]|nr:hypothetical protein [Planctomycetota bacterium]